MEKRAGANLRKEKEKRAKRTKRAKGKSVKCYDAQSSSDSLSEAENIPEQYLTPCQSDGESICEDQPVVNMADNSGKVRSSVPIPVRLKRKPIPRRAKKL